MRWQLGRCLTVNVQSIIDVKVIGFGLPVIVVMQMATEWARPWSVGYNDRKSLLDLLAGIVYFQLTGAVELERVSRR
jgi:hypothetical protein